MAEFRRATGLPVATNMIATNWREMGHAVMLNASISRWRTRTSGRSPARCGWRSCATTGGSPGAAIPTTTLIFPWRCLPTSRAAPGNPTAIDTHWIWQEGDARLTKDPLQIINGSIAVPDAPGLGVELDWEQVRRAHEAYKALPGARATTRARCST